MLKSEAIKSVSDNIDNNTMISDTNEIYDLIDKEIKSLFIWLIEELIVILSNCYYN